MFGSSSSLPPLVSEGGGLVCESVGKADLFSDNFDSISPGRLLICRSLVIRLLVLSPLPSGREKSGVSCMLALDPHSGPDSLGVSSFS